MLWSSLRCYGFGLLGVLSGVGFRVYKGLGFGSLEFRVEGFRGLGG